MSDGLTPIKLSEERTPRAFLCKAQNRRTADAQPFARRLSGTHYDGDLVFETHANLDANGTIALRRH
jgi:hypothetical protein